MLLRNSESLLASSQYSCFPKACRLHLFEGKLLVSVTTKGEGRREASRLSMDSRRNKQSQFNFQSLSSLRRSVITLSVCLEIKVWSFFLLFYPPFCRLNFTLDTNPFLKKVNNCTLETNNDRILFNLPA